MGFFIDDDTGQLIVAGIAMGKSRKYKNVHGNSYVSFVVDDLVSTEPWKVRGVEVRGTAEPQHDVDPPMEGLSREIIRITPRWIGSWGLDGDQQGLTSRGVRADPRVTSPDPSAAGMDTATANRVRWLAESYFRGFDERRFAEAWLSTIFSDDVTVRFPAGQARGIAEFSEISQRILSLWGRTLHQTSDYHVISSGPGDAEFRAVLTATHVHRADDPGAHLRIGAQVSGRATHTLAGWRIQHLALELVWTEGDRPTPPRG
ncbi:MAG TPA: PPOX class F420-dependent oxidoreductase [Pseudonocardiaceae bacterium]|nr:PPOX class F420-dependent oxidoreductase [Pseudonocardiaceae bacterium]